VQLGLDALLLAQIKAEHFQTDPLLLFCFPKPHSNYELKIDVLPLISKPKSSTNIKTTF